MTPRLPEDITNYIFDFANFGCFVCQKKIYIDHMVEYTTSFQNQVFRSVYMCNRCVNFNDNKIKPSEITFKF